MAFEENGNGGGMVMPVSPMGGFGNGFGSNGFGADGWWIILLVILFGANGWGGYGNGGGAPCMVDNSVQRGFDQAAVMGNLNSIESAINNGFSTAEVAANARQIADMQQNFAMQSQFADCCCENRLATADLKYTIATENCADRYEAANNTRDIIENATSNTQVLLDKICALELDAKNDRIAELERQLTAANFTASQTAQTAEILARLSSTTSTTTTA